MKDYNFILFILSLAINGFITKSFKKYNLFLDPVSGKKLQSIHLLETPRAGGISIYSLSLIFSYFISYNFFVIVVSFLPAFIYLLYEDLKGNTSQKIRLAVISLSTLLAIILTDIKVQSIGFIYLPEIIQIPFTIFGVIGIASSINIIDGLNGLASGISIITLFALAMAAALTGNIELADTIYTVNFIILGFMVFNFPYGKVFLGDAGAYFLGYLLAMFSCSLVLNDSQISPWYPAVLLAYPIIETLFTTWRRYKRFKNKGINFFQAEKIHLHSLVYLRLLKNNSLSALFILVIFALNAFLAYQVKMSDWQNSILFLISTIIYLFIYKNIVNFKLGKIINIIQRIKINNLGNLNKKEDQMIYENDEQIINKDIVEKL